MKRTTPEDDITRLAENLNRNSSGIVDKDTFDIAFDNYMVDLTPEQDSTLRTKVFNEIRKKKKGVSKETVFSDAGGKDLARDRRQTSKRVTTNIDTYKRVGAQNIDLKGYDTKRITKKETKNIRRRMITRKKQTMYNYNVLGIIKGRQVYARRVNTKRGRRHIDKRGRYVRVIKK